MENYSTMKIDSINFTLFLQCNFLLVLVVSSFFSKQRSKPIEKRTRFLWCSRNMILKKLYCLTDNFSLLSTWTLWILWYVSEESIWMARIKCLTSLHSLCFSSTYKSEIFSSQTRIYSYRLRKLWFSDERFSLYLALPSKVGAYIFHEAK